MSKFGHGTVDYEELQQLANGRQSYLIDRFMLRPSINILAGHSGLGKSAFCAQMGLSVASGRDFLGYKVDDPGPVIYCDAESTPSMMEPMTRALADLLDLDDVPDNFVYWNPNWNISNSTNVIPQTSVQLFRMVANIQPKLVILDSLRNFFPLAIKEQEKAAEMIRSMRKYGGQSGTSFLVIHHLRKGDRAERAAGTRPTVKKDINQWLEEVSGTLALINNTDLRCGWEKEHGSDEDFWFGGFLRVYGPVGPFKVRRMFDSEGFPLGYRMCTSKEQLTPAELMTYEQLPWDVFEFSYFTKVLRKSQGASARFVKKCLELGILRVVREDHPGGIGKGRPRRVYIKTAPDEFVEEVNAEPDGSVLRAAVALK
jgi:hypothetical protein